MRGEILELMNDSEMTIDDRALNDGTLLSLVIEIRGALAAVPSLKNSKLPGTNYINPKARAKLLALDALYFRATRNRQLSFADERVFMLGLFGGRSRSFDVDNAVTSLRDWLEPSAKSVGRRRRSRGWGVGVVANDRNIVSLGLSAADLSSDKKTTLLVLKRWRDLKPEFVRCIEEMFENAEGVRAWINS